MRSIENFKEKIRKEIFNNNRDSVFDICDKPKKIKPHNSDTKAGKKNDCELLVYPKNEPSNNPDSKIIKKVKNQELIKDILMFCTFKSFHFEFRNTFPSFSNVDLSLLFRSKSKRKYTK